MLIVTDPDGSDAKQVFRDYDQIGIARSFVCLKCALIVVAIYTITEWIPLLSMCLCFAQTVVEQFEPIQVVSSSSSSPLVTTVIAEDFTQTEIKVCQKSHYCWLSEDDVQLGGTLSVLILIGFWCFAILIVFGVYANKVAFIIVYAISNTLINVNYGFRHSFKTMQIIKSIVVIVLSIIYFVLFRLKEEVDTTAHVELKRDPRGSICSTSSAMV